MPKIPELLTNWATSRSITPAPPVPFQVFPAQTLEGMMKTLEATPGSKDLVARTRGQADANPQRAFYVDLSHHRRSPLRHDLSPSLA